MKVIVVGAGIVGMSVAYHLAALGTDVLAIDAGRPGGRASAATFACINFFNYWQPPYFALRRDAIEYERALAVEIGAQDFLPLEGTLRWGEDEAGWTAIERSVTALHALGIEVERWRPADVQRHLEPDLDITGISRDVVRVPGEGWMDGVPYIGRLLAATKATGRFEWLHARVTACETRSGRAALVTSRGTVEGDALVLAGGIGTRELALTLGVEVPIKEDPGVMLVSDYLPSNVRHALYAGHVHVRPDGGGRIMAGRHGGDFPTGCSPETEAQLIGEQVARRLPALALAPKHTVLVGVRPVPRDGYPIVDRLPGHDRAYVVSCHSGMTLGPLLGKLAANEVLGATEDRLAPYRLARFTTTGRPAAAGARA